MRASNNAGLRLPKATTLYTCLFLTAPALALAQQQPGPASSGPQKAAESPKAPVATTGSSFNEEFLSIGGNQPHADLSIFAFGNQVLPGEYMVDVQLEDRLLGRTKVHFVPGEASRDAVPCLTPSMLDVWGVNVKAFSAIATAPSDACIDLQDVIPDSKVSYDASQQRLLLSVPQAALRRSARGAVDPSRWDQGITAAMLDYQLNWARNNKGGTVNPYNIDAQPQSAFDGNSLDTTTRHADRNSFFAGLRVGANYGDWRFRSFSNYSENIDGRGRWQSVNTYAARDLPSIRGQLLIGEGTTSGNFFDSMQFRGVQLSSDDAMLPDSLQGYAPTIRGVAQTNARVTIRQNGYIIYNTYVAPGPFVIDDLYATASGGDLDVTITEADGRTTRYTQAFSAVPTLLRQGAWRYQATVGKYRNGYYSNAYSTGDRVPGKAEPFFLQGTLARGVGNEFTVYGGFTGANMYQSLLGGVGKNLKEFGAVSADLTVARTSADQNDALDRSFTGQSLRFLYAKSFVDWGTNFRVAGYRYSSSGFRTFAEAVEMQDQGIDSTYHNRRNEMRFDISQRIGDWGAIFASGRQQSYWGSSRKERLFQIGYSGAYKQVSYNIFYNYSTTLFGESNRQIAVSLSIPLGDTRSYAQYTASHDNHGNVNQQASVYGSAFDDSRLTYNVTGGHANNGGGNYGSASASYLSQVGRVDAGYSNGRNYGQTTLGLAGGVVVHSGGVTLAQPLGESVALVEAPKAEGVGFESQPGVATDSAGYAVIPNLAPYRTNRLAMRTADLGDMVDVKNAATEVVPTRGAVVLAKFDTTVGYRLMMTLTDLKGQPLPFGARIEDGWGREVGVVGPDGQSFVTGAQDAGQYNVVWGSRPEDRCVVSYALPKIEESLPIREVAAQCLPSESGVAPKEKTQ